ncbi:MAG TPA: Na+/H+ antiporter subunit E [Burkholderiales bacterium]|nr:Na+/H+ antiporter subunit E [Burkholderiales bacterium]
MPRRTHTANRLLAFTQRALLAAALWWVIAEGEGWLFGVPLIAAAAAASVALQGARVWRLRPVAALRMALWFLGRSLVAGVDIALRALRPRLPIAPGTITVTTRLTDPAARVLFADALSLVPGTLSTSLSGAELRLHLIDRAMPVERDLRALEAHIAALFGETL